MTLKNSTSDLHPARQDDWRKIIEESCYHVTTVATMCGMTHRQISSYITDPSRSWYKVPKAENFKKVVKVMSQIINEKRVVRHPSFGYATEDEVKRLSSMKKGEAFDRLMKTISDRSKKKGKRA